MTKEIKETPASCNGGGGSPSHSKTPSIASSTATDPNSVHLSDRLQSSAEDDIIQKNLKELMDKKNREERKANGRLVAVILASLVIFLAIYHIPSIKKSGLLAGVLVPAVIMLSFGGWVVVLAKRDKAKRAMFEKYLEEVALKNKQELDAKKLKPHKKANERKSSNETLLEYVNEINKDKDNATAQTSGVFRSKDHRKHRKHRNIDAILDSTSSPSSRSHYAHKDLRIKRPSIRQKLFRQTGLYHMSAAAPSTAGAVNTTHSLAQAVINTTPGITPADAAVVVVAAIPPQGPPLDTKRKRLQRIDALQVPTMVRMGSVP